MLVVDGQVLEDKVHEATMDEDDSRPSNLSIVLGNRTDRYGQTTEYTGVYANLNVFSSPLANERMIGMTKADGDECGAPGDFLSWKDAEWQLTSKAREATVGEVEGPCRKGSSISLFNGFMRQQSCMEHCQKLSHGEGRSPPLRTLQELNNFQREFHAITPNIGALPWFWVALKDGVKEGEWEDFYTQEKLENYTKPWYPGHNGKYGGGGYDCVLYFTDVPDAYAWGEYICESNGYGCPCQYKIKTPYLLGLDRCEAGIDYEYKPHQVPQAPSDVFMLGILHSQMRYNSSTSQWVMSDVKYPFISAVSEASEVSYLLGTHQWTFKSPFCNNGKPYTKALKLTECFQGSQFTCDNGQCVSMEQRCNQLPDCRDKSDERGCSLLVFEDGYNMKVPPITSGSKGSMGVVPAPVHISLRLLKIVGMEEVQHKIDFQFEITLEWKENRIRYKNLKVETSLSALTIDEINALWLPYVVYVNTDMKKAVRLNENDGLDTTIVVKREGNFVQSPIQSIEEIEIFEGKDNSLVMYQTYTKNFQCEYHLQAYPFDTQASSKHH